MNTRLLILVLVVGAAWIVSGCGHLQVTTPGEADHPRDPDRIVLLCVTMKDAPSAPPRQDRPFLGGTTRPLRSNEQAARADLRMPLAARVDNPQIR